MGLDLSLSAVLDFGKFIDDLGLDSWGHGRRAMGHELEEVMKAVALYDDMDLNNMTDSDRDWYHPQVLAYVRMLAESSPSTMSRRADVGRHLRGVTALLDSNLSSVSADAVLYGEIPFDETWSGTRYTTPDRCALIAESLDELDISTVATGETSRHIEEQLLSLTTFYRSATDHGEGALCIYM